MPGDGGRRSIETLPKSQSKKTGTDEDCQEKKGHLQKKRNNAPIMSLRKGRGTTYQNKKKKDRPEGYHGANPRGLKKGRKGSNLKKLPWESKKKAGNVWIAKEQ